MEPISAVASIITLLGAGSKISDGLSKLITLRNAPDAILALNNEVADCRLVIEGINDLLQDLDGQVEIPQSLLRGLDRATQKILDLEKFIAYDLTVVDTNAKAVARVDQSRFLRLERKIVYFQQCIRDERLGLSLGLNALNSKLSAKHLRATRRVEYSLENVEEVVNGLQTMMTEVLDTESHISRRETRLIDADADNATPLIRDDSDPALKSHGSGSINVGYEQDLAQYGSSLDLQTLKIRRRSCAFSCRCRCHSYTSISTPRYLDMFFGSLFIGYRASPFARKSCNIRVCRPDADRSELTYKFPAPFTKRIIYANFSNNSFRGPEFSIRIMNVRGLDEWQIIGWLFRDERTVFVEACRQLSSGETSIYDVDPLGRTLLHYAALRRDWDLAKLLIANGSDVSYEGRSSISPIARAVEQEWNFGSQTFQQSLDKSQEVFGRDLKPDETRFSLLHEAYRGLNNLSAEDLAQVSSHRALNMRDALGKSVLLWAAGRGDSGFVATLIQLGAEVQNADYEGSSALHEAVHARSVDTARLLLNANASVNAMDFDSLPAIYYAAVNDDHEMTRLLLEYGADVELGTRIQRYPLFVAIMFDHLEIMQQLCDAGAQLLEVHWQVILKSSSHRILRFLLAGVAAHTFTTIAEVVICMIGVIDLGTIGILKALYNGLIDLDMDDSAPRKWALHRRDHNVDVAIRMSRPPDPDPVAWHNAFMDMVDTVNSRFQSHKENVGHQITEGLEDSAMNEAGVESCHEEQDDANNSTVRDADATDTEDFEDAVETFD